jgi:hypothetical protein
MGRRGWRVTLPVLRCSGLTTAPGRPRTVVDHLSGIAAASCGHPSRTVSGMNYKTVCHVIAGMVEELFGEAGACSGHWDPQAEVIVVEWLGDVGGDTYREWMERILDAMNDRDANKLLTDSRQQGLMAEADQVWTVEDWEPRAIDAGLEYVAVVYPDDRSAKTTVDMSARRSPHTDLERVFTDDFDEARHWLTTK